MRKLLIPLAFFSTTAVAVTDSQSALRLESPGWGEVVYYHLQDDKQSILDKLLLADRKQNLGKHQIDSGLLLSVIFLELGLFEKARPLLEKARASSAEVKSQTWLTLAEQLADSDKMALLAEALSRVTLEDLNDQEKQNYWLYQAKLAGLKSDVTLLDQAMGEIKTSDPLFPYLQIQRFLLDVEKGGEPDYSVIDGLAGQAASDEESVALVSRANLMLGQLALSNQQYDRAIGYFQKVSNQSPDYTQALLGLGWSNAKAGNNSASIKVWKKLAKQTNVSDAVVLESKVALPYFLESSNPQQAIEYYEQALEDFNDELVRLRQIELEIDDLQWIPGLVEEGADQLIYPGYFVSLLENTDFQWLLANYRQLNFLGDGLEVWQPKLTTAINQYDYRQRQQDYYVRTAPLLRARFQRAQTSINQLQQQVDQAKSSDETGAIIIGDPAKTTLLDKAVRIENRADDLTASEQQKLRLIKGKLIWQVESDYYPNLRKLEKQLIESRLLIGELEQKIKELTALAGSNPDQLTDSRQLLVAASARLERILVFKEQVETRIKNRLHQHMRQQIAKRRALLDNLLEVALDGAARLYDQSIKRRDGGSNS